MKSRRPERPAQHLPVAHEQPLAPTLAAVVREREVVSWARARSLCVQGRVSVDGLRCLDPAQRIDPGAVVAIDLHAPRVRPGPLADAALVFFDAELVVVDKPAGMLSVADVAGNKQTLFDYTQNLLRRLDGYHSTARLGVVHRLDRETSGLLTFARTPEAKQALAAQFRAHDVERIYRAIVHGAAAAVRVETDLIVDRGDGLRGSYGHFRRAKGPAPREARRSITCVRPLEALTGATLVECRLETGRQHQIRIHLSELGHPLVGERVYIRDYEGVRLVAPRPMLHARTLGFAHPRSGERLSFEREAPADFLAALAALRS